MTNIVVVPAVTTIISGVINIESARCLTPWADDEEKSIREALSNWAGDNESRIIIDHVPAPGIFWGTITIHCKCHDTVNEFRQRITGLLKTLEKEVWVHSYSISVTIAHGYDSGRETFIGQISRGVEQFGLLE